MKYDGDELTKLLQVCEAVLATYAPDRFLKEEEVLERTGLCRTALYEYMRQDKFPKSFPVPKGSDRKRWSAREVFEWMRDQHPPKGDKSASR